METGTGCLAIVMVIVLIGLPVYSCRIAKEAAEMADAARADAANARSEVQELRSELGK